MAEGATGGRTWSYTARIAPTRSDSDGIEVVGDHGATDDVSIRAWTPGSLWKDGP